MRSQMSNGNCDLLSIRIVNCDISMRMSDSGPDDVTKLLIAWKSGNKDALDQLIPLVYQELHKLARSHLNRERGDHTLQPTALIHEAYVRLIHQNTPEWKSRTHFFGIASQLMRQILVDHARKHCASKRGGGMETVPLDDALIYSTERAASLLQLDDALTALAALDQRKSRVLELRYFAGMSPGETAEALGVSERTITRDLRMAEAWLRRELSR